MKGVLIDLDGVIYQNDMLIPGAERAIAWLQRHAIPHLFLTNTTSQPKSALLAKLSKFGIQTTSDALLTPPSAAAAYLRDKAARENAAVKAALFVPSATREDFNGVTEGEEPSAVVVGDLGAGWDFAALNRAFNLLIVNPSVELIALGMTRYWRSNGGLQLDVGAFARALAFAAEKEPIVMGKPSPTFFQQAAAALSLPLTELCMIGDDIKTDVLGAQACGIKGVLVKTGKYRQEDLACGEPDLLLGSLADLPQLWPLF
jgi:phospholysine phosphohistidine inorganic pyrophosphate phosphatase